MALFRRKEAEEAARPEIQFEAAVAVLDTLDPDTAAETEANTSKFEVLVESMLPDIEKLGDAWDAARGKVDTALNSDTAKEAVSNIASLSYREEVPDTRLTPHEYQRGVELTLRKRLPESVKVAVVAARYDARASYERTEDEDRISHVLADGSEYNMPPGFQRELFKFDQGLYRNFLPTFELIEELNQKIMRNVGQYLGGDISRINQFTDWLKSLDTEQVAKYRPLLSTLARDIMDPSSRHIIQGSLEEAKVTGSPLMDEFIQVELEDPDSEIGRMAQFAAKVVEKETGKPQNLAEIIRNNQEYLPESALSTYKAFVGEYCDALWEEIESALRPYNFKMQRIPTRQELVNLLELRKQDTGAARTKRQKGRVAVKHTVSPDFIDLRDKPDETIRRHRKAPLGVFVAEGGKTRLEADEESARTRVSEMIQEYTRRYPHDSRLAADIEKIIDAIQTDPFGHGTTGIEGALITTEQGQIEARRLSPINRPGLSVGQVAKKTRVTYYPVKVNGNGIAIAIEGIRDHDEYERWIRNS